MEGQGICTLPLNFAFKSVIVSIFQPLYWFCALYENQFRIYNLRCSVPNTVHCTNPFHLIIRQGMHIVGCDFHKYHFTKLRDKTAVDPIHSGPSNYGCVLRRAEINRKF